MGIKELRYHGIDLVKDTSCDVSTYEVIVDGETVGWLCREYMESCGDSRFVGFVPGRIEWVFNPEDFDAFRYGSFRSLDEAKKDLPALLGR
jgi:hypothetical protein